MENPVYHLEGVVRKKTETSDFDGPLSLILLLLTKNKISIRDIRVSDILDQYLDFIDRMQRMDIELASEFVQMASHLLYIKTKAMLPGDEDASELSELVASLELLQCREVYSRLKPVTAELAIRYASGALLLVRGREPPPPGSKDYAYSHEPRELLSALLPLFSRERFVRNETTLKGLVPSPIVYKVSDKTRQLLERLRVCGEAPLDALFKECESRSELVATFISILELCAAGRLSVTGSEDNLTVEYTGRESAELMIEAFEITD